MKHVSPLILALLMSIFTLDTSRAQGGDTSTTLEELPNTTLKPVFVFERGIDKRQFWRLVQSVKRVYPLAKVAQQKMQEMEQHLETIPPKERREYIRSVYREIKEEYTPVLLKMTYTDGRVLIRLIDRETDYTAYEVLDEFRGRFTATMWQGIGRLFGHNLKDEYGESVEDRTIERIIRFYEAGLL